MLRRKSRVSKRSLPSEPQTREDTLNGSLDTLAAALRAFPTREHQHSPRDDDEPGQIIEAWARHVLTCSVPPNAAAQLQPGERDWAGLRHFVVSYLEADGETVERSLSDLQGLVWMVVESMSRAVADDLAADSRAHECLEALRDASERSLDELKRVALTTVEELATIIESRTASQRNLAQELGENVTSLRGELEHVRHEAETDGLTQLANRQTFDCELKRAAGLSTLSGEPCSLILLDLDSFKAINDRYGHMVGDATLKAVADTLVRTFLRRSDLVSRYGGDEFAIILRDLGELDAVRLAIRVRDGIRLLELPAEEAIIGTTISTGVAEYRALESPESWLARADSALYTAKTVGRDRVEVAGRNTARNDIAA